MRERAVTVLAAIVLVSAPIVGAVDLGVDEAAGPGDGVPLAAHGGDHPPIRIHGDEQFLLPSSGVTGGSGSAEDPYVISGWTVKPVRMHRGNAFQDGDNVAEDCKPSPVVATNQARVLRLHGIEIVDTSAHVVIEDVTVVPREDTEVPGVGPPWNRLHVNSEFLIGILLRDADNVTIRNVTVGQADGPRLYRGICAKNSDDLTIQNSTVQHTVYHAIELTNGGGAELVGNVIADSQGCGCDLGKSAGVLAETVPDLDIRRNRIEDHATFGIKLIGSDGASLTHNTVESAGWGGIVLGGTDNAVVADNVAAANKIGLEATDASGVEAHGNNFRGNTDYGVKAVDAGVDATQNWWGDDSGPSGGVTDDCTGTTADGDGDAIWIGGGATVCFDPWLTSPNLDAGA